MVWQKYNFPKSMHRAIKVKSYPHSDQDDQLNTMMGCDRRLCNETSESTMDREE
jgi:hypothetical protein